MKKKFLYVANWKAYLTFNQAREFIRHNKAALKTIGQHYSLIICPSFDVIATIAPDIKEAQIALGGQDCSAHQPGAYTGQVLAKSLHEAGCTSIIVGHSEVKAATGESLEVTTQKAIAALDYGMIPIICVGETAKDYEIDRGIQAIEEQLTYIFNTIAKKERNGYQLAIAYEPLWSIGSSMPTHEYLKQQIMLIRQLAAQIIPHYACTILYGGGIDEVTIGAVNNFPDLDGIVIGKASTDFATLQKIILS
jgi:triosephosphate isomerase